MAKNYSNPPIKEALIEAWPALDSPPDLETLSKIAEGLPDRYLETEKIIHKNFNLVLDEKKKGKENIKSTTEVVGLRRKTASGKNIIQLTKNFFTANWVGDYKSGDDLLHQFQEIWDSYTNIINVSKFRKIAVRFINVFEVPSECDSEDYIKISFNLEGSEQFEYFELNKDLKFTSKKFNASGNVKVSIKAKNEKIGECIFDIATYRENISLGNFSEFKKHYKVLRNFKNEIFELNLTEKQKESFK